MFVICVGLSGRNKNVQSVGLIMDSMPRRAISSHCAVVGNLCLGRLNGGLKSGNFAFL